MVIKVALLVIFFGVTVTVGLYFRSRADSVSGFVLAGRSVGPWLTAFAYGTSYFSAVVFVGYAGQFGWRFGTAATWIGLANAFIGALLPWFVLGKRTRLMSHHLNSSTMPEFFGQRFDSTPLKIGASVLVFIFLIPYTASLYNGLSRLFAMAYGVDFTVCIVAMALLTAVFVIAGGYFATAVNDFIQGIVMLIGIVVVLGAVLSTNGGFTAAITGMANVQDPSVAPGAYTSFFGPDPVNLLGVMILTSLGTWGLPQMVGKFYAIKSEKTINIGAVVSTFFSLIVAGGCYFLGSFGRLYSDRIDITTGGYDSIIPTILSEFPDVLIGLVIVLVLSASISTLSSLVMVSASTFTLDFLKGNIIKKFSDKSQLLTIRVLVIVFITIASIIATIQYQGGITFIAQLMGISWGALAGSFLAPFLYSLYWKRTTNASIWACFIFSTTVMVANIFFRNSFPTLLQSPINAGAFTMLMGLVIVPVVSLLTKVKDTEAVESHFKAYDDTSVAN
ncbi:MAG: sodium:solute symporter [Coriobacteriia bacterium]|nr:sodium:solute symporter [Coriobacteriia bacterium]